MWKFSGTAGSGTRGAVCGDISYPNMWSITRRDREAEPRHHHGPSPSLAIGARSPDLAGATPATPLLLLLRNYLPNFEHRKICLFDKL